MDSSASTASDVNSSKRTFDSPLPLEETAQKRAETPVPESALLRVTMHHIIVVNNRAKEFPRIINDADHWAELLRSPASGHLQNLLKQYLSVLETTNYSEELKAFASRILEQLVVLYDKQGLNRSLDDTVVTNKGPQSIVDEFGWDVPFAGKSKDRLYHKINDIARKNQGAPHALYSQILPIVQSSGMGKSRVVDEIAREIFTIPFCLRDDSNAQESGFPFGDAEVVAIFKELLKPQLNEVTPNQFVPKLACVSFFTAIFEQVINELALYNGRIKPLEWHSRLREMRHGETVREKIYDAACASFKKRALGPANRKSVEAAVSDMRSALSVILGRVDNTSCTSNGDGNIKLVVSLDECHSPWTQKLISDDSRTGLDFICYALDECKPEGLFGILLSTKSVFTQLSFPNNLLSSHRKLATEAYKRSSPFVYLDFDVWNGTPIIRDQQYSLKNVCSLDFLARFGRPLWWTRLERKDYSYTRDRFLDLPRSFLLGRPDLQEHRLTPEMKFAIISSRLALELNPLHKSSRDMADRLVASHMAVAYYIPDKQEYMRAGYPSEPILAEAAASIWNALEKPHLLLREVVSAHLISKRELGELVARYILIRVQDLAIRSIRSDKNIHEHTRLYDRPVPFSEAVPLWRFFSTLFNPKHASKLASAKPRNKRNGMTMEEACKNKYVRFNHFARAGDASVVSTAAAWKALARANAWQCDERQDHIDIIVPVHVMDEDKGIETRLGRDTVTFILVKVKNTSHAQTVHFSAELLQIFDDIPTSAPVPKDIPYFVIVFNLGVPPAQSPPLSAVTPASPAKLTSCKLMTGNTTAHTDDPPLNGHSCYWIEVRGCSSEVLHPEISQGSSLRDILATRSVFHQVKQEEHEDILRFKPMFMEDSQCFSWAQDSNTSMPTPGPIDEDMEDVLVIEN